MAAPSHVPTHERRQGPRAYSSPPRRAGSWTAERAGDLGGDGQPSGAAFGSQGPDQGYAIALASGLVDELSLQEGEHRDDVLAGLVAVALKRASLFGRAPVIHDLRVAATVYGFVDPDPDPELVSVRRRMFEEVASPHHHFERLGVADAVPESTLRLPPAAVADARRAGWATLLEI